MDEADEGLIVAKDSSGMPLQITTTNTTTTASPLYIQAMPNSTITGTLTSQGFFTLGGNPQPTFIEKEYPFIASKSDLDHAVFKTPIKDLVNLWLARYGPEWVEKNDVAGDEFFGWAALRLKSAGKLEEHKVWEPQPHTVLRLIDEDNKGD